MIFPTDSRLPISIPSLRPLFLLVARSALSVRVVWSVRVLSLTLKGCSRFTRPVSCKGDGSTLLEAFPSSLSSETGCFEILTQGTGIIKWIYGPSQVLSQQLKINLFCSSLTVPNDPVNQLQPRTPVKPQNKYTTQILPQLSSNMTQKCALLPILKISLKIRYAKCRDACLLI